MIIDFAMAMPDLNPPAAVASSATYSADCS